MPFTKFINEDVYKAYKRPVSSNLLKKTNSVVWQKEHQVEFASKKEHKKELKHTIRLGIPDDIRGQIWCDILGVEEIDAHDRNYKECLFRVFGPVVPASIECPDFGAESVDPEFYCLNEDGRQTVKNILCILANDFPNLVYCPFIKNTLCIICHHLSAYDALGAIVSLIKQSEKPFNTINTTNYIANPSTHNWNYFPLFRSEIVIFARVFLDMVNRFVPKVARHIRHRLKLNPLDPTPQMINDMIRYLSLFFVSILPLPKVFRVCDSFFCEGYKAIFRYCLGYMIQIQDKLTLSGTWDEFRIILLAYNQQFSVEDMEKLHLITYKDLTFGRNLILTIQMKIRQTTIEETEPVSPNVIFRPLPKFDYTSEIVNQEDWLFIWRSVPQRFKLHNLEICFTTTLDGYNLGTLYKKCDTNEPLLILVETTSGETFGAYIPVALSNRDENQFFGNGESFLFKVKPNQELFTWHGLSNESETLNSNFVLATRHFLALGAGDGGYGLWIDASLTQCSSSRSDTFRNEPLTGRAGKTFEVACVEVYSFVQS